MKIGMMYEEVTWNNCFSPSSPVCTGSFDRTKLLTGGVILGAAGAFPSSSVAGAAPKAVGVKLKPAEGAKEKIELLVSPDVPVEKVDVAGSEKGLGCTSSNSIHLYFLLLLSQENSAKVGFFRKMKFE